MDSVVQQVQRLGQSFWFDNISRGLIESGELQRLIDLGVGGLTSNPTIFEKAIAGSSDYDDAILELARAGKNVEETYEALTIEDIRAAADLLRLTYDRTERADGYASLEVSPHLAYDTDGTVAEARRLFATLDRSNVMIKVPATSEGIPAVRRLIGQGINVNVTLTFSLDAYRNVRQAYIDGLEDLEHSGGDVSRVASVASFFVSRVDTAVDKLLEERAADGGDDVKELLGRAAIANAKLAYRNFRDDFGGERFASLRPKGAQVQRPLWASTSTKNPEYSDVMYVESLIGPDTVNTLPEATLTAFLEHGQAARTLDQDVQDAALDIDSMEQAGISMEQVTAKLLADGVKLFADSYDKLIANIEEKRVQLLARDRASRADGLGESVHAVETALAELERRDVVGRIWAGDHTVWKPDRDEIADRLGWLNAPVLMRGELPALVAFAEEVRDAGFRHVVIMGMGGSSLGPETMRQTFGSAIGYPELIILDSIIPASVRAVEESIDPARTLFLVSSKSGGTVETGALYSYFRDLVEQAVGAERAGANFVAITDEGTPLAGLAQESGFRRVFLNPSDVGGRYSVLSYFGLVPAALMGLDLEMLLDRTSRMRGACSPSMSVQDNPGTWLGAAMGALALHGRDKLTLITSPSISSLESWIEQLIAESTGKEGRGIIPVAGEPSLDSASYGNDRLFVYLRLEGDENSSSDAAVAEVKSLGWPVVGLGLRDRYDLGAEFFRWEFATAVAGSVLGVNPFDQPHVQQAKEQTERVLREHRSSGRLPRMETEASIERLLSDAREGDYLVIMAFARPTPELDRALTTFRTRVAERHRIATTVGYGPRYLHSTGQLHKDGPDSGLFIQLTMDFASDIPIPGEPHTFGGLADAQALGDLRALRERGRRIVRVGLGEDQKADIIRMADELR